MSKHVARHLPVFIQLSTTGLARTLLLRPEAERVIIVGSIAKADFPVSGLGVAPIQFHLERDDEAVCLVPAYGAGDLRVNAVRAFGPTPLEEDNIIEFGGTRLRARLLDVDAFSASSDSLETGKLHVGDLQASYSLALPGDEDVTQVAMRAVSIATDSLEECASAEPRSVSPMDAHALAPQHTERMAPYRPAAEATPVASRILLLQSEVQSEGEPAFTLNGTQLMAPYRQLAAGAVSVAPVNPLQPSANETVRLLPLRNAPRPEMLQSRPARAGHVPPPATNREAISTRFAPAPATQNPPALPAPRPLETAALTHRPEMSALTSPPARPGPPPLPATKRTSWLARLGLMTKAHPLVVASGASAGALLVVTVLILGARLVDRRRSSVAAPSVPVLVSQLNSLRPASSVPLPSPATAPTHAPPEATRPVRSPGTLHSPVATTPAAAAQRRALY